MHVLPYNFYKKFLSRKLDNNHCSIVIVMDFNINASQMYYFKLLFLHVVTQCKFSCQA